MHVVYAFECERLITSEIAYSLFGMTSLLCAQKYASHIHPLFYYKHLELYISRQR